VADCSKVRFGLPGYLKEHISSPRVFPFLSNAFSKHFTFICELFVIYLTGLAKHWNWEYWRKYVLWR